MSHFKKQKIKRQTFGGYSSTPEEIFKEAIMFLKEHPNAEVLSCSYYSDEGVYMDMFWEDLIWEQE